VDGGPKIIRVAVDGVRGDGGPTRQCGWGRVMPRLRDVNGAPRAALAPTLKGRIERLRLYGRAVRTAEAVANFRAGP